MPATLLLFVLIAAAIALTGTDGFSYLTRMTAILLVGTWVYADSRPGDFLATGTWLFGTRIGFELGMIAEMAMGMAQGLSDDFSRIRLAMVQKGQPWGIPDPARRQDSHLRCAPAGGRYRRTPCHAGVSWWGDDLHAFLPALP